MIKNVEKEVILIGKGRYEEMFNPQDHPRILKEGISPIRQRALNLIRKAYTAIRWPLATNEDNQVTNEIIRLINWELERKRPIFLSQSE